jgi:hypothetical protein
MSTLKSTCGPHYLVTFYVQICFFNLAKTDVQNDNFPGKIDFLFANLKFEVQNDETHLLRITWETCVEPNILHLLKSNQKSLEEEEEREE